MYLLLLLLLLFRVLALLFHATILEPNFDLSLSQVNRMRDLDPPLSGQVLAEAVFFFKLKCLLPRIHLSMFSLIMRGLT